MMLLKTFTRKLWPFLKRLWGRNIAPVATLALNNLAAVYGHQGRTGEAINLQERAIAIYLKTVRPSIHGSACFTIILPGPIAVAGRLGSSGKDL